MLATLKKIRARTLEWGTQDVMLPIIRRIKQLPVFPYTAGQLSAMQQGSLGQAIHNFLQARNLHLLPGYESHDVKHVLLGYDATEEGEASMQYFFLGNGDLSIPVLLTVAFTLIFMPDHYSHFRAAYARGKATPRLAGTPWFSLLSLQTAYIQQLLQIPPRHLPTATSSKISFSVRHLNTFAK